MQKLYCYIDETGQDTEGKFFLVSVIITQPERNNLIQILENIEKKSGKGRLKWARAKDERRIAYITAILQEVAFKDKLYYAVHQNSKDYATLTVITVAQAITEHTQEPYKATVIIDGLQDSQRHIYAAALRKQKIQTNKVVGADDDKDALLRLADALCGFVRDAIEGKPSLQKLLKKAVEDGYIVEVGK